jgi:hypothetical protein
MKKDEAASINLIEGDGKSGCLQQGDMRSDKPIIADGQLVDGETLLKILFPESSRPTTRWLADQKKARRVPFLKVSRLCFYDPEQVRAAWHDRFTVGGAR